MPWTRYDFWRGRGRHVIVAVVVVAVASGLAASNFSIAFQWCRLQLPDRSVLASSPCGLRWPEILSFSDWWDFRVVLFAVSPQRSGWGETPVRVSWDGRRRRIRRSKPGNSELHCSLIHRCKVPGHIALRHLKCLEGHIRLPVLAPLFHQHSSAATLSCTRTSPEWSHIPRGHSDVLESHQNQQRLEWSQVGNFRALARRQISRRPDSRRLSWCPQKTGCWRWNLFRRSSRSRWQSQCLGRSVRCRDDGVTSTTRSGHPQRPAGFRFHDGRPGISHNEWITFSGMSLAYPVHNSNFGTLRRILGLQHLGSNSHVVEEAESHCLVMFGVVTWRSDARESVPQTTLGHLEFVSLWEKKKWVNKRIPGKRVQSVVLPLT